uniref:Chromosome partition protein Smc n=1 Tax=Wolbachia endosymbiont of Aleurodicus dispersus TaxID=1288877 RepID=A0A3B0J7D2_9RICK
MIGNSYNNKIEEQKDDYHDFIQRFLFLLSKIKEKNKSIHTAVASFHILSFLIKYNANFNEDEVYKAVIQDFNNVKEARPELQDKAKKVLNGYIESGVETVSIYGSCAEVKLGANKNKFKVSEFLNSNFCQDNGISGFSTLHSNGKNGMHGFVSEEGIRHYVVTDGAYEMTLNWCNEDGKKCTIIINIDANGIELIERNRVTDDQLKANKDVKIGNLFLYQIKFRNKEKGNHKSSEIVIENSNRNINIQTTQEIERGSKEAQIDSTKMQDKSAQVVDESLNERINKLEKENTRLTGNNQTILEQLQQKMREVEELNGKVREKDEVLAEVTQKLKQLSDSVEIEFERRKVEKEKLEEKLRKAQKEIQKLSKEKAELVQEKQGLEEYAKVLVVKRQKLVNQIGRSDLKLYESINENKRLEQELNDTKKDLGDKYSEIQRLESQSHELESKKVTELITCLEKKEKKIAELEAQLQKESSETCDLILKSSDLEEEKRRLQEKLDEKTQEVMKLTVDLEELSNQSEEKETKYFSRIKELEKILNKERKNSGELKNYSINLEEESQIHHEKYKELLFEKNALKEEISDLNDQSSLAHQNYVNLAQDLATNMICLFKENVKEGDNVIISQKTLLEIFNRFEELIKNFGVSDQEIKEIIEEISVQTNDSPASSNMSNGDLSALPNKELDEASYSEDFGYSSRCSTPV